MQILEYGQAQERTLLFFPCTAEPVWAFADTVAQLSQSWRVFQVVYDGHQPEYPGDFTSVEQTVDAVISYLKSCGISQLDGAYGCSMGGACLTRMLALGEMPIGRAISKWRQTAERYWKRLFRRDGLPQQGMILKRNTTPWKPISRPSLTEQSAIYSGLPTTMRFRSSQRKLAQRSPTGTVMTKRRIAGGISGSSRVFPQTRIHGIPKMAHAELVMVHPEKFCRYAEKFLILQAEEV